MNFSIAPHIEIEVLVVDGLSEDTTVKIVERIANIDPRVKLLINPSKIKDYALNVAIKAAKGNWLLMLDTHSTYPSNYLLLCYETALRTKADNVDGLVVAKPSGSTYQANLIQALTTHPFGVGNSRFRIGEGR